MYYIDGPIRSPADAFEAVTRLLEGAKEGSFEMTFENGHWISVLAWRDESLEGATAMGTDKVAAAAVEACLREAGL